MGRQPVVLALGGGGMRGLAHLGVLRELEESGVDVAAVAGTSSGALMAALWLLYGADGATAKVRDYVASGLPARMPDLLADDGPGGLRGLARRLRRDAALARMLVSRAALSQEEFFAQMGFFLPDVRIDALPLPFVAVATDNATGEEVRIASGPLRLAVGASSAMPGLVAPIPVDGRQLQDGGAVAEIPVGAARQLGSPVVAVEVSEGMPAPDARGDRSPRAMLRAAAMGWQALRRRMLADADAVIAPRVNHLHWAEYRALEEAVDAGRAAARSFLQTW